MTQENGYDNNSKDMVPYLRACCASVIVRNKFLSLHNAVSNKYNLTDELRVKIIKVPMNTETFRLLAVYVLFIGIPVF